MPLFLISSEQQELDAFVRGITIEDAVAHWKDFHKGAYNPEHDVTVTEVPPDTGALGVIPWDTLKSDDIDL